MAGRIRVLGRRAVALIGCAVVAACSSPTAAGRPQRPDAPPATRPYLVMTGPESGWAVWPSGDVWVLLRTADGFRHVQNDTPPGVPTDGGLVAAAAGNRVAVAVGTVERLVRSPILTRSGTTTAAWMPGELPAGVVAAPSAVALRPAGVTVVTTAAGGTLLAAAGTGWRTVVDARALPDASGLRLDGASWAGDSLGWITGSRPAPGPVAFQTRDGGRTWTAVQPPDDSAVAALAPCGAGAVWSLPELDASGRLHVLRTRDAGVTWAAGPSLPAVSTGPVWGCHGQEVWAVGGSRTGNRIYASSDAGATWTAAGPAPAGLTALRPTGAADGFAAGTGRSPALWRVTGAGSTLTRIRLPSWVAGLGAGMGED